MVFRLTINNKPDNQDYQRLGDRDLSMFANRNQYYHTNTYTYTNMVGGGNANVFQNYQHNGLITQWHFIYYGYSKADARAFAFFQFRSGTAQLNFPKTNHFWSERFYFLLKDSRYPFYQGTVNLVTVNLGKGAFKADGDFTKDGTAFGFPLGQQAYQQKVDP
jgi:hypothetical protein